MNRTRARFLLCLLVPMGCLLVAGMLGGELERRADAAGEITVIYFAEADSDGNGIPDNPFAVLSDEGLVWLASVENPDTGLQRTVAVRRVEPGLSADDEFATLDLDVLRLDGTPQRISVEVPRAVLEPGEIGVVLLSVAADAVSLLGKDEAALLAPGPEGVLVPGGQYVDVSVMVSNDRCATYTD
ncbi:MAG: hypothetical protein IID09_08135, partial [Candidatus Hydrogenedentes bacterium]|nr:hypothetical protein [Candidatus Hydrogenedentota bacterium]